MIYLMWFSIVFTISMFAWLATKNGWLSVIAFMVAAIVTYPALDVIRGEPLECDLSFEHEVKGFILQEKKVLLLLDDPVYCWIPYSDPVAEDLQKELPPGGKKMIGLKEKMQQGDGPEGDGGGGMAGIEAFYETDEEIEVTIQYPKMIYEK